MRSLKEVLIDTEPQFLKAGGEASVAVKRALREHRDRLYRTFVILLIVAICAFGVCLYALFQTDARTAKTVIGAAGLGTGGGTLGFLYRIWKDWSQTSLLLILVEDAPEASVVALVKKLIARL